MTNSNFDHESGLEKPKILENHMSQTHVRHHQCNAGDLAKKG